MNEREGKPHKDILIRPPYVSTILVHPLTKTLEPLWKIIHIVSYITLLVKLFRINSNSDPCDCVEAVANWRRVKKIQLGLHKFLSNRLVSACINLVSKLPIFSLMSFIDNLWNLPSTCLLLFFILWVFKRMIFFTGYVMLLPKCAF